MSNEKAVDYFDRHPSSNECHITSDERVFHTKGTADGHANVLKDTKVNSHYRSDYELMNIKTVDPVLENGLEVPKSETSDSSKDETPTDPKTESLDSKKDETPAADKVFTNEDLKTFDFESGYEVIKAIVKALGIESPSQSKKDLLEAIAKAKDNLEKQS
ncbi:hypothetical protein NJT12_20870 [Flavobacterium sp. AC]|uniref:Uncharacterized protein n=1 Tax=Flavobacterium azizsancarii TaxID=2961580 RepID=A0ABT4WHM3_9FLAO|nr:hypothetical protein [Flavobacterium azizsancarii]MDA6072083.1 hypothetical protein [Flavobacterium azizsancarii]